MEKGKVIEIADYVKKGSPYNAFCRRCKEEWIIIVDINKVILNCNKSHQENFKCPNCGVSDTYVSRRGLSGQRFRLNTLVKLIDKNKAV